ncbi:DUF72 domain-containing protein [Mucilaginibacter aquariorum]|uniref:DUF72 domain-containing protein n=1 Tax=Mucilaginibacter aquariorum TaxID=2967225 RepID=A0ABT1SXQ8_9SPHI|nr:DUF72 domain-containing protein [Mucilaginibacter aquariorum]MCQ6957137.1 DUF72 domain-containing protein [Mucilaginibacter aquariorum]
MSQPEFYAGTSGLVLPVPNKAAYPPEFQDKSRLCYYASLFNSIEVNSSFYKIPQAATIRKWRESVPDNFRFTFKLWRGITHEKDLQFNPDDITRFMNAINEAGEKKGSLLIQFPPSIRAGQLPQLGRLLEAVREADDAWDIAVELRHSSLYQEQTDQLLTSLNMAMVIHDLPASAAPPEPLDLDFIYLRFHGPNGGYRGSYADDFLAEYAQNINQWIAEGKRVYTYFNNTMGAAVHNLATLNQLIQDL